MPSNVSSIKLQATKAYGAEVVLCKSRQEAEDRAENEVSNGAFLLPPFDHDQVICGQGTACLEALKQIEAPIDAVFAPCGGGGLLSGTWIAAKGFNKSIEVHGAEPIQANDVARSLKSGGLFRWTDSPNTLADGAKTLSATPRTLEYLKKLDELCEVSESDIVFWTQWLTHLLKLHCEPTSALGMVAAYKWIEKQTHKKNILIILSGGNIDQKTSAKIWEEDFLNNFQPN